jgi:hypothetical protein
MGGGAASGGRRTFTPSDAETFIAMLAGSVDF